MDRGQVVTTGTVEEVLRGGAGRFTFRLPVGASVADLPRMLDSTVKAAGGRVAMTGPDLDAVVDAIFRGHEWEPRHPSSRHRNHRQCLRARCRIGTPRS